MIWVLAAVGSAFVNLAVSELVGWLPWLAERIVRWSARLLPGEAQRRYEDEWLAELDVLPGSGISALVFALRIRLCAQSVSRALCGVEHPKRTQFAVKQGIDRAVAAISLLSLAPIFVIIALMVKLTSRGPVLTREPRTGPDGREFELLAFRSTRREQSSCNGSPIPLVKARSTFLGRLLRHISLDELPQFVNVLRGDMSLIGPRPERLGAKPWDGLMLDCRHMKSGITGWSQVHCVLKNIPERKMRELDSYYLAHWSLVFDLKIVVMTVVCVFKNPTAQLDRS